MAPIAKKTTKKVVAPVAKKAGKKAIAPVAKKTAKKAVAPVAKKTAKKAVAAPLAKKVAKKPVAAKVEAPVVAPVAETPVKKPRAPRKPVVQPVMPEALDDTSEAVETVEAPQATPIDPTYSADPILLQRILTSLDDDKAEEIMTIDLAGRSSLCDAIVVASGRSSRHVSSIAEHLARRLKEAGYGTRPVNGAGQGDWALVDAGDVIVHIFRPEVRSYYDLEGMWSVDEPKRAKPAKA